MDGIRVVGGEGCQAGEGLISAGRGQPSSRRLTQFNSRSIILHSTT